MLQSYLVFTLACGPIADTVASDAFKVGGKSQATYRCKDEVPLTGEIKK